MRSGYRSARIVGEMNDNVEHRIGIMGSQELKPLQVSSQVWEPALSMLTTYENLSTKYNYDLIADVVFHFLHDSKAGLMTQFKPRKVARWFLDEYHLDPSFYDNESGLATKFDIVIKTYRRTHAFGGMVKEQYFYPVRRTTDGSIYALSQTNFRE